MCTLCSIADSVEFNPSSRIYYLAELRAENGRRENFLMDFYQNEATADEMDEKMKIKITKMLKIKIIFGFIGQHEEHF